MSPRPLRALAALCLTASTAVFAADAAPTPADPHQWLEDVGGDKALAWVREHNATTDKVLKAQPGYEAMRARLLEVLDASDRIPMVSRQGEHLYNLWKDKDHPRGLWRRTTLAEYKKAEPKWDVVLDLDALAKAEGENWVWGGADCLPGGSRCLISTSRGGADAKVVREFDLVRRTFVKGGFALPEAKSAIEWLDANTLLVGTDFGPGSMTDSGYPRVIKRWLRGTPLARATTVFEVKATDMSAAAWVDHTPGYKRVSFVRTPEFFRSEVWLWQNGKLVPVDKPADVNVALIKRRAYFEPRADWTVGGTTWPKGSLLSADAAAWQRGERKLEAVFSPTATRSLESWTATQDGLLLNVLDNVVGKVAYARWDGKAWQTQDLATPSPGKAAAYALHDPQVKRDPLGDAYLLTYADFLTPESLYLGRVSGGAPEQIKSRQPWFDAGGMKVEQRFATSKDGTRVPYFVVWPKGATASGDNPTLLYGYGGFEVPMEPFYSGSVGNAWLTKGGVYVLANIRGGGEFGPAWHQAALKENRQRAYDDFIAVAEDLIATKVTNPKQLGAQGGSNGGLLMGVMATQRPDLFNAIWCQVPLLDMRRFNVLLAGASWMAEYGNPDDPAQWAYIAKYSPYHNLKKDVKYPPVLFQTSTRDDRVHPGHARKMAARMEEMGLPFYYNENIEGGHGGAADNSQRATMQALGYSYLWMQLAKP